jgi:hypothetical protein
MSDSNVLGIDYAKGATFIGDTTTRTGRWAAIHFTTNTHIDAIVAQNYDGNTLAGSNF